MQSKTSRRASSRVLYFVRLVRARLDRWKRLSTTALFQQFPRRLILGTRLLTKKLLPPIADELGTLVGMQMHFGFGFAPPNGHDQDPSRGQYHPAAQGGIAAIIARPCVR
jgi:hypothetical protein